MKIRFYHNQKPFAQIEYEGWEKISNSLIRSGLVKGNNLNQQISTYQTFIKEIQKIKKYKISEEDQTMYIASILALYKLEKLDPDHSDSPLWITPV